MSMTSADDASSPEPGPVAVVTGAGGGIGRAVAVALLGAGYRVALAGRRSERLKETLESSGASSAAALVMPTDVCDESSVQALFECVRVEWSRIDLLFNNAGIFGPSGPLDEVGTEDWLAAVNTNLTGAFFCTRQAFRMMKNQRPRGGRIINNGSLSAQVPRPHAVSYTATKHAITGLTKATALEGRQYDIACGQIDIGNAVTEMTTQMAEGVMQADGTITVEPRIDVHNVADAVLHIAALPLDVSVPFFTIMATKMPFLGRG